MQCVLYRCACFADVPVWLKSLRLHKYAYLFQQLTYEEMMSLTETWLEQQVNTAHCGTEARHFQAVKIPFFAVEKVFLLAVETLFGEPTCISSGDNLWLLLQNVTKGARHKIILSVQKLKERQNTLRLMEKVSCGCKLQG